MLGKFYTTTQNVVNAGNLIPLNSCRTCGGGFKIVDGNAIEICKGGCYEVNVAISASSADITAPIDISLVVGSKNNGAFEPSAGARAIETTTTAGAISSLSIVDTVKVCNNSCCDKVLIALRTVNQITVSNVIVTVRKVC